MIVCHHCGHDSKVVETKQVLARLTSVAGQKRKRSRTVCRVRQCKKCKYRWKTMEVPVRSGSKIFKRVAKEAMSRRARFQTPKKRSLKL